MHSRTACRLLAVLSALASISLGAVDARRFTKDKDAVRLADVNALTFYRDRESTHRRVPALPQLTCVSGSGCAHFEPESIRCVNSGSSYDASSIEWTCTASLPPEFKLGSTEVVCEGYDNPDDDLVLKGSCALEYRLLLTDAGIERFGASRGSFFGGSSTDDHGSGSALAAALFWAIFIGIAAWILYSLYQACFYPDRNRQRPRDNDRRGWRGGWDDDGDDDPPPPYSRYQDYASFPRQAKPQNTKRASSGQAGSNRASSSRSANSQPQQGQQRPWWQTFGAGAATGGAAAYMAANARNAARTRDNATREQQSRRSFFNMMGRSRTEGGDPPRSFFGRPSSSGPRRSSFGSSSPSSFSETRYESTGFGGTRRR